MKYSLYMSKSKSGNTLLVRKGACHIIFPLTSGEHVCDIIEIKCVYISTIMI